MPVTNSAASNPVYLFTPTDCTFNQALNTDLTTLAHIANSLPNPAIAPSTASYTVALTDYQRVILSSSSPSTLSVIVPSTLASGMIFSTFRDTNNLVVAMSNGLIVNAIGSAASTMTFTNQWQSATFMALANGNIITMASNTTLP